MDYLLGPAAAGLRRDFDDSTGAVIAAKFGCAVEIARGIADQAGERTEAVSGLGALVKAVQDLGRPGAIGYGRHLEDRTVAVGTALLSCAVEIAGGIEHEAG